MKTIEGVKLNLGTMEEMCDSVRPGSKLSITSQLEERSSAQAELKRLVGQAIVNEGSHLQQGIRSLSYAGESVSIQETPLQYPSPTLVSAVERGAESQRLLGSMTGVFTHVFNEGMYVFHVRGQRIAAPGKIQITAGMGEYGLYPADLALKEAQEELGVDARLVLPHDHFLDVTPFMKGGKFPQPLFSYIATGNLGHIGTVIEDNVQLERFEREKTGDGSREAYPFVVPISGLQAFMEEVHLLDKFYGPVRRTAMSFLNWYESQSD